MAHLECTDAVTSPVDEAIPKSFGLEAATRRENLREDAPAPPWVPLYRL